MSKPFKQQNFLWMSIFKVTDSFSSSETRLELASNPLKPFQKFFLWLSPRIHETFCATFHLRNYQNCTLP